MRRASLLFVFCSGILSAAFTAFAAIAADQAFFVPPPRTIADITAILDQEKPDQAVIDSMSALVKAEPPAGTTGAALAKFYYSRSSARFALGRVDQAIDDIHRAIEIGRGALDQERLIRYRINEVLWYQTSGQTRKSLELIDQLIHDVDRPGDRHWLFYLYRHAIEALLPLGDRDQAVTYGRRLHALEVQSHNWPQYGEVSYKLRPDIEFGDGLLFLAQGRYEAALKAFKKAELSSLEFEARISTSDEDARIRLAHFQGRTDKIVFYQAKALANLGRLAEAEVEARRALLRHLKTNGKYDPWTSGYLNVFSSILLMQGRYLEAERLLKTAIEIGREIGLPPSSRHVIDSMKRLAAVLNSRRRYKEAAAVYAGIEEAIQDWPPAQKETVELNSTRIYLLFAANQLGPGLVAAKALAAREVARAGESHFDTAVARGILAIGLARAKQDSEALAAYRAAIPRLLAAPDERDYDDTALVSEKTEQVRSIVEAYLAFLARILPADAAASETFPLADAVRSQAVRRAVSAASARMIIKDPGLSALARQEQDQLYELNAALTLLNNALSLPAEQRDEKAISRMRATVESLKAAHLKVRSELDAKFKGYSQLIAPKPAAVAEVQTALKDGEAFLSFYFGEKESFVWAVPKQGKVAFAVIAMTANDLEDKVNALRQAVTTPVEYLKDIPPFDTALAYNLYQTLLQPVEEGWKSAKTLFVVSNGALGQLPLALLPTEAPPQQEQAGIIFADYRAVKWLARSHATVALPSAAVLKTLRSLPAGPANRAPLIGFGDPYFSEEQAAEADASKNAPDGPRGVRSFRRAIPDLRGVDSADLARLPRLPDTADELRAVAVALGADPVTSLKLGRDANEKAVMTADLAKYRVVAFSTHGLVGGELDGLTQPALALTAPKVAGIDGDGLLTMDKILSLKLDADWTVLSACNTGTGIGAEAEASSGLGRAFFYAGSRTLLVTNWPVDSPAAKELVSSLFRRQTENPSISRAEALRLTIVSMIDDTGVIKDGKMVIAYAHPYFWAPYTIMGDPGA